jgi:cytidylate kinase
MTVWTISAEQGTGGVAIATELAARAGVPLLDRKELAAVAHAVDPELETEDADELEERVGGRLNAFALGAAMISGSPEAFRELQLRKTLPELGRAVLRETARCPAVVLAHGGFAILADHPSAVHVRLRAPFAWRVAEVQRCDLLDRERAKRLVRHDDHLQRSWVRTLYHADLDDPGNFGLVVDVSRLGRDQVVELLLAAGGQVSGRECTESN